MCSYVCLQSDMYQIHSTDKAQNISFSYILVCVITMMYADTLCCILLDDRSRKAGSSIPPLIT